ncbi:MAG: Holliday junction resolvase RuvX [Eubacteriales bacterium]|nr:Holliday junction resolvase RuvX [Eubacteriales bacterium]
MKKILALDVGDRRVGVAFSSTFIANPVETYVRKGDQTDHRHIAALAREMGAELIVAGLPRNMDGSEGGQAEKARDFAEKAAALAGIPCLMWDERLSSVTANAVLSQNGVKGRKRRQYVDRIAAVVILQNYLDYKGEGL